jgi:hypothetical protein
MKTNFLLLISTLVFVSLGALPAHAVITTYTSRSAWETAVLANTSQFPIGFYTETFDGGGFAANDSFAFPNVLMSTAGPTANSAFPSFTISSSSSFYDPNDDNSVSNETANSDPDVGLYLRIDDLGPPTGSTSFTFSYGIDALGFDYSSWGGGSDGIQLDGGTTLLVPVVSSSSSGFFGFIDDSTKYTTFSTTGFDSTFGIDNISAVPEANAALLLSIVGGLSLGVVRFRRWRAKK